MLWKYGHCLTKKEGQSLMAASESYFVYVYFVYEYS